MRKVNPTQDIPSSKYIGKRVVGTWYKELPTREKVRKEFHGICVSSYYTLNDRFKNQHFVVQCDDGKTRRFTAIRFEVPSS